MEPNSLLRQLQLARFDRAMEVTESLANHRALLTTSELARVNAILNGKDNSDYQVESWRTQPITLELPSGRTETFSCLSDPKLNSRDKLHKSTQLAEDGDPIEAAVFVYVGLIMLHPFKDANRRTAVLAAQYFLLRYGVFVSGVALHELGVGDVRDPAQVEALRQIIRQMAKFSEKRKK